MSIQNYTPAQEVNLRKHIELAVDLAIDERIGDFREKLKAHIMAYCTQKYVEIPAKANTASKQVLLCREFISGIDYFSPIFVNDLKAGDQLELVDVVTLYDPHAISVLHSGKQIGWVPRNLGFGKNIMFNMIKSGINITGVIQQKLEKDILVDFVMFK